jgi:hypothetical protein
MAKELPPIKFAEFEQIQFYELLGTLDPGCVPHILSCGAGVDSLALLIEYILNPASRDFPLCNLVVVHATVGGESEDTKRLMEEVIFPLCRQYNIWFIQAYRSGQMEEEGITLLSSTRQPHTFYLRGDYCLLTYLSMSGTVPQRGGSGRLCTIKFKGWVIDKIAIALFGDSPHQRFVGFNADESKRADVDWAYASEDAPRYLIGYNADETKRVKDSDFGQHYSYEIGFNADEKGRIKNEVCTERKQVFRFPLIEMGHGRQWCEDRVNQFAAEATRGTIVRGRKSFCLNCCPFPECNGKKRQKGNNTHGDLREDWLNEPQYGGEAAFIEHISLGFNIAQPLYTKQLVVDILQETGNRDAINWYKQLLDGEYWPGLVIPHLQRLVDLFDNPSQAAKRMRNNLNKAALQSQLDGLREGRSWGVYLVRRMFCYGIPMPFRQTKILHQGHRADSYQFLENLAARYGQVPQVVALSDRFWTIQRPAGEGRKPPPRPFVEESFVLMPATAYPKQRISDEDFNFRWLAITGSYPQIRGIDHYEQTAKSAAPSRRVERSRIAATKRKR